MDALHSTDDENINQEEFDKKTMIRCAKRDKEHPFLIVSRALIFDNSLSLKDRMVLIAILSNSDYWQVNIRQLALRLDVGISTIESSIRNLKAKGYCRYVKEQNEKGQFICGWYEFTEEPKFLGENKESGDGLKKKIQNPKIPAPVNPRTNDDKESIPNNDLNKIIKKTSEADASCSADAERCFSLFIAHLKKLKPDMDKSSSERRWKKQFDKMIKKYSLERILKLIEWLPTSSFWSINVLSPEKMMMQFDRLELQAKQDKEQKLGPHAGAKFYAQNIMKTYIQRSEHAELHISDVAITFVILNGQKAPIVIPFSAHGFTDQVENNLRKYGFKKKT